jgi:hypothetical protein
MTIAEWRLLIDDRRIEECRLQAPARSRHPAAQQEQPAIGSPHSQSPINNPSIGNQQSPISNW